VAGLMTRIRLVMTCGRGVGALGEDDPDRRAPSVSDGGVVMGGGLARPRSWAGVTSRNSHFGM
jgi:hypothetical protein